jgi:hypothetical protein
MAEIKEVYVTKVVHEENKQYGFARIIEDATQVFIPPNTVREFCPSEGEHLVAQLEPNNRSDVPWRMTMVYDEDGPFKHLIHNYKFKTPSHVPLAPAPEPIKVEPTFDELCLESMKFFIEHDDYFYVTRQVEQYVSKKLNFKVGTKKMGRIMDWLHKNGHISMLVLHKSPDQGRASKVAWCKLTNANEIFTLQFEEYEEDDT